jgi:hypothetical protein
VTWSLDAAAGIVRVRYSDPYTIDDWVDAMNEIRRAPTVVFQRQLAGIIDRGEVGPPRPDFIEAVTRFIGEYPTALKGRLLAFVLRDEPSAAATWAQIRMCEDIGAIAAVFGSVDEAERWLREQLIASTRPPDRDLRAQAPESAGGGRWPLTVDR